MQDAALVGGFVFEKLPELQAGVNHAACPERHRPQSVKRNEGTLQLNEEGSIVGCRERSQPSVTKLALFGNAEKRRDYFPLF